MKVRPLSSRAAGIIGFGGAAALMLTSVCLAASDAAPPQAPPAASTSGSASAAPGATDMAHAKTTFQALCNGCHEAALATDARYSRKGWEGVVERMYGFGLSATEAQAKEIVDYLSANYAAAD